MSHKVKVKHAIVIGAGTSGLLAARVLRERAAMVTLIERDTLTEDTSQRRGIPQGQHFHLMLGAGSQVLNKLFPTLFDDLDGAGIEVGDCGRDWILYGPIKGWQPRFPNGIPSIGCTRAELDRHLRRLLLSAPNIELRDGQSVSGLCVDTNEKRINGVRLKKQDNQASQKEEILRADLVVDASGRGSRTPAWLVDLGYSGPPDEEMIIDLAYGSRLYREPPGPQPDWRVASIQPDTADGRRGGFLYRINDGMVLATLFGYGEDHPPSDSAGFLEFARSLPKPQIYDYLRNATAASEYCRFKFPSNRLRHYEQLADMPAGLVILGDAVFSTNPTHGQGMTMACLSAVELGRCIDEQHESSLRGLSCQFQKKLATLLAVPWSRAIVEELRRPSVSGRRPLWLPLLHWYTFSLLELSSVDKDVFSDFSRVMHMLSDPGPILRPQIVLKVLLHRLRHLWDSSQPVSGVPTPDPTPRFIVNPHAVLQRSYTGATGPQAERLAG